MAIESYDPSTPPNCLEWLGMGEEERNGLDIAKHHSIGDRGDGERTHCLMHVIVENQLAMGAAMEPVRERLRQLMAQGLDRHRAVHAIGYVVLRHMSWLALAGQPGDQEARYFRELKRMTAQKWLGVERVRA